MGAVGVNREGQPKIDGRNEATPEQKEHDRIAGANPLAHGPSACREDIEAEKKRREPAEVEDRLDGVVGEDV